MKYRKKPVVIDAMQFLPDTKDGIAEACRFIGDSRFYGLSTFGGKTELKIKTLEGWMTCIPGAYLIRGVRGEVYPCQKDIFEETYEQVHEAATDEQLAQALAIGNKIRRGEDPDASSDSD